MTKIQFSNNSTTFTTINPNTKIKTITTYNHNTKIKTIQTINLQSKQTQITQNPIDYSNPYYKSK